MRTMWLALALAVATTAHAGKKNKKNKKDKGVDPPPVEQVEQAPPAAEPEGELVTLPCEWEPGSTFEYSYVRMRTDSTKPELADVKTTTPLTVTVDSSGPETVFSYDTGEPVFDGPDEVVAAVKAMVGDADFPPLVLVMREGMIDEVRNQAELVELMEPMLARMMPPDAPPEVIEQTMAMFRDPATGTQLLLRDPGKMFSLHCVQMTDGQVFETPMQFPNPFGGPPIDGYSRLELAAYDAAAGTVTFHTRDGTDPEALKAMMPAVFQKFAPEGAEPSQEELDRIMAEMPPIESLMVGTLVYSLADGFPLSIDVRTDIGAPGHARHRSDTWIWTRAE